LGISREIITNDKEQCNNFFHRIDMIGYVAFSVCGKHAIKFTSNNTGKPDKNRRSAPGGDTKGFSGSGRAGLVVAG
jgi:hypothetical protein